MRSSDVEADGFSILSDEGDIIGGAVVIGRKTIEVTSGAFVGFTPLPNPTPEMQAFAEAHPRRLGMLDDAPSP